MAEKEDWAGPRPLRIATILSFAPAFPLCVAHGVVSRDAVPAVGLVPLAASAGVGIALLSRNPDRKLHPAATLAADLVLAAALMVVLVFTWIVAPRSRDAGLSMLASYATMPLIVSFLIHLFLVARAVYIGLALDSLTQWLAWQVLPPDCPNCQHRLRPPLPSFPWLRRSDDEEQARLLVDDEAGRYRDEEDNTHIPEPPVAEEVTRKDRKGKAASPSAGSSTPWDI